MAPAGRAPGVSAPAAAMAGATRSDAATGAAAPSRAQLRPPKAIMLVPTATWAYTTTWSRPSRPVAAASASAQKTTRLAPTTRAMLQATGRSRSRVARYWSSCSRRRWAVKRSIVQPARPNRRSSLAAGGSTASR